MKKYRLPSLLLLFTLALTMLPLPASALAFYTADNKIAVEPGTFNLWVAPDAISGTPVEFTVTE